MKALSIRQPWATLIIDGIKKIENRKWNTDYRGPLLIHAAKKWDDTCDLGIRRNGFDFGCIIGQVILTDCVTYHKNVWFEGPYGFVLENPIEFKHPIVYKGQLGLFNVDESIINFENIVKTPW